MAVTNSPKTARKGGRLLKQLLAPLVGDASPVTVIGLCKNAGKTTAMRRLMAELGEECLGLTSVGRDGECTDLVTGTEKPDLPPLTRRFQELGAQRVLIDGAAGRKSLAGAGVEGVALLCTGASLDRDMELVVAETAHTCWLFARKRPESAALCAALDGQEARFALFTPEGEPVELPLEESGAPKWNKLPRRPLVLWAAGGIMDPLLKTLARRGAPTTLVAADATHVLAGRAALDLFLRNGGELRVRRELTIAAVGANPWSAYGWHFEPDKFVRALREVIDLPVVNVKED